MVNHHKTEPRPTTSDIINESFGALHCSFQEAWLAHHTKVCLRRGCLVHDAVRLHLSLRRSSIRSIGYHHLAVYDCAHWYYQCE